MSSVTNARRLAARYLPGRVRSAMRDRRDPPPPKRPPPKRAKERPAAAAPKEPRDELLRALERGKPLPDAVVAQVRALIRAGQHHRAESLAEGLRRRAETEETGHLAAGLVAFHRGFAELAWHELSRSPRERAARLASTEYARAGLAVAPDDALREIEALADADPPEIKARAWFNLMGPAFGYGAGDLARRLWAIFDRHVEEDAVLWKHAVMHRDWMRPWMAADPVSPGAPAPPDGRRTFALIDYGHPGRKRGSANIGDHVQSIAAVGHLVRHQGVRLHGPAELVDQLERLRGRTRPERRLTEVDADLEVRTIHRDASAYQEVAEDTWVLCFGWFMHALFKVRHGFPLHDNVRPIFISFHCNKRDLLTPDAVDYLKRYGPVGCRDWTTVYLLLSMGVPAFFSGCLTTTIDTVFPDLPDAPPAGAPAAYVDMPADAVAPGGAVYEHSDDAVRVRPFTANVDVALDRLDTYRRDHSRVVTSRLHCYLPLRSIGTPVEFRPKNRADIRFDGLIDLDDAAFDAVRAGILDKLERVIGALAGGRPEAEVYELWREITRDDVAEAERRLRAAEPLPKPTPGPSPASAPASARATYGTPQPGSVDCAVWLDGGAEDSLGVLAASLAERASRPVHVWTLGGDASAVERTAARVPDAAFTWLPAPDGAALLPELLADVARLVVLPLPAVATGDVAELASLDLGGHGLAALSTSGSGFGVIHAAAGRLGDRIADAAELRRTAHARHAFDFDAFETDVLVLDLDGLRAADLPGQARALRRAYGLSDLEVLHYLAGPNRAPLPPGWAVAPTRTSVRAPGLLHWPDPVKPWQPELTPERERWREHAARNEAGRG